VHVDLPATGAALCEGAGLRGDVEGALHTLRGAGRHHSDAVGLLLVEAAARAGPELHAGEEPERGTDSVTSAGVPPPARVRQFGLSEAVLPLPVLVGDVGVSLAAVRRSARARQGHGRALDLVGDVVGAVDEGCFDGAHGVEDVEADGYGAFADLDGVAFEAAEVGGLVRLVLDLFGVELVEAGEVAAEAYAEGCDGGGCAYGFAEVGPVECDGAEVLSGGGGGVHRALLVLVGRYGGAT
jgi:hypothetical protein